MTKALPNQDYSRTIFTVMKDEAPYILEWVSYHLAIGFTHFVVLTNDCSDGTEKILRNLASHGLVTQKNNPGPFPRGPQKNGYLRMRNIEAFEKAKWMMTLDCDEYLRIDVGNGHLDDLFKAVGETTKAISFIWQLFGANGRQEFSEAPTILRNRKAAHPFQARPYETLAFKTLYQNGYFSKLGTHRPNGFIGTDKSEFHWIDADGVAMDQALRLRHWKAEANGLFFGTALGRVNHYALRSVGEFLTKWHRGFVHPNAPTVRGKGLAKDYWHMFNWNDVSESSILRHSNELKNYLEILRGLDKVRRLEEKGIEWHKNRALELRQNHPDLFEEIIALPNSNVLDDFADFSSFGCPPIGNQAYVDREILKLRQQNSCLSREILDRNNPFGVYFG